MRSTLRSRRALSIRTVGVRRSVSFTRESVLRERSDRRWSAEARKDVPGLGQPEMRAGDLSETRTEISRDCEIASLVALLAIEPRPPAVDLPAAHAATDDH